MAILTKSNQNLSSRARLQECAIYDPDTGSFTCKTHQYKSKYYSGDILGSKSSNGYLQIYIDGIPYLAHRLAWLLQINGQRIRLGFYDSAEDAGIAYEEAAKLYHMEFAYGNFS